MPRSATHTEVFRERFGSLPPGRERDGAAAEERSSGPGPEERPGGGVWPAGLLSALASAAVVSAAGVFCAFCYIILKDLRADRVRREDGTEERMLGFWSILVLSVLAGCICCSLSCILTYLDSYGPDGASPTSWSPTHCRDVSGQECYVSYGVALLNGIMAMLTVVWSLS
ncbi:ADP-ribosylation factor-like protein 6-interacting protein 6 [Salarias fasciatus]|uniref:Uncharacterized protein n=1 Tax=Salarias fasciatus TaxID=181472 RepID=A0A672IQB3_SALFA|nr:ADP-ribosylation factor-like protein 6-interacting protein 6 [Salarias fasciatus]